MIGSTKEQEKKNGISLSTSNGNMVSPPSSTLDKYNKKEATCKIEYDNMNNEQWQFHHHEHEEFFIFNKTSLLFFFFLNEVTHVEYDEIMNLKQSALSRSLPLYQFHI